MIYRWQQLNIRTVHDPPVWLDDSDSCYYLREYTPGVGYSGGVDPETNQRIYNYKKPVGRRDLPDWKHKERAIRKFAAELVILLRKDFTVTWIPTSRKPDDPDYDSRLEDTLEKLKRFNQGINIVRPISRRSTVPPVHLGGNRNPNLILPSLKWNGLQTETDHIMLIDDVLTSGAHFKACKQLIQQHEPEIQVIGVFWARCVHPT